MSISRRDFVARTAAVGLGVPLMNAALAEGALAATPRPAAAAARPITIFSKPLQWLSFDELGAMVKEIGFDGINLPVRPNGHVVPERVAEELPRAAEAFRRAGLSLPVITTAILDPRAPATEAILRTAASLGVGYYRLGDLNYPANTPILTALETHRARLAELAEVNKRFNISGAYQNHAGTRVGSPVWDLWHLMKDLDPRWIGIEYDIRHATAEGGSAWPLGLRMVAPHVRTIDVKDFVWQRNAAGRWVIHNVPLGEGMVDFPAFFKLVKELNIGGPISIHYEYAPYESMATPANKAAHVRQAVADMRRDLTRLREMLDRAEIETGNASA